MVKQIATIWRRFARSNNRSEFSCVRATLSDQKSSLHTLDKWWSKNSRLLHCSVSIGQKLFYIFPRAYKIFVSPASTDIRFC